MRAIAVWVNVHRLIRTLPAASIVFGCRIRLLENAIHVCLAGTLYPYASGSTTYALFLSQAGDFWCDVLLFGMTRLMKCDPAKHCKSINFGKGAGHRNGPTAATGQKLKAFAGKSATVHSLRSA